MRYLLARQWITRIHVAALTLIVLAAVGIVARAQVVNGFSTLMDAGPIASQTCSSSCSSTTLLGPVDTTGYGGLTVEVTAINGNQITLQGSNDGGNCTGATNWFSVNAYAANISPGSTQPSAVMAATGIFVAPIYAKCLRVQITTYGSGAITAAAFLRSTLPPLYTPYAAVTSYPAYPGNNATSATPVSCGATGSTAAVTCTLAGTAGKTTYICGFDIEAVGGTAAVTPAVATLIGSVTMTYTLNSSATGVVLSREFTPCIPTTAANTAITVTSTADGTATAVDVNAHGFQL